MLTPDIGELQSIVVSRRVSHFTRIAWRVEHLPAIRLADVDSPPRALGRWYTYARSVLGHAAQEKQKWVADFPKVRWRETRTLTLFERLAGQRVAWAMRLDRREEDLRVRDSEVATQILTNHCCCGMICSQDYCT